MKPFKFRYANELAGAFVLLTLALLIVGVMLAGHAKRWFEPVHRLKLQFPPEGSLDVQRGAEVRILGTQVGSVQEIEVEDDGRMTAVLTIRGDFIRFVRQDSTAIAKKMFGVAGDAYIEITRGAGPPLDEGAALACLKDIEIMEAIHDVVRQVREATLPAIEQVRKAIEEYTNLAADLRSPEGNLQQLLGHLNRITEGLEKGEGTAGRLLRDASLANELREITGKINDSLADVRRILDDVQESAAVLKDEVHDVPGIVLQTRDTMRETERLITAIQRHWLLRKYVEQAQPTTLIPSSAVGGGK